MTRALVTSAQAASSPAMRVRARGLPAPGLSALGVPSTRTLDVAQDGILESYR